MTSTTKTFITNAISFAGSQAAILVAGVIGGYLMGWTSEHTASVTVAIQMAYAGWTIRGWC